MSSLNLSKRSGLTGLRRVLHVLGGMLGMVLLCLPMFSQGSFGRILGTVTDTGGGVIPGAIVTVLDTERGVARTLMTDDAGAYNAPNLTPGTYTVRAEAKGFKRLERQNVVVEVGREVRVDLTVQPGQQDQTITVTEAVPLVETTNATMGGTLENADIVDLPLNGRDYQNLLGLRPGVLLMVGGGPWTQSTNNVRPDESVWMIEGVFNANPFDARPVINMPSPFTDGATILPVDAIQEFNTMENPKAEYGWKAGAVVNVGIKSGTNQLHGAAYAFGRTDAWDARNYFNIAPFSDGTCAIGLPITCAKVPAQLTQFGGVVGGPIKKDKLFFFGGYEGLRSTIASAVGIQAPLTAESAVAPTGIANCPAAVIAANPTADCVNSMVDAINSVGAAHISKVSESLICPNAVGQALPLPSNFVCTGGVYEVSQPNSTSTISNFPISNTTDNGVGKLDYHLNDKNTINGVFFLGRYNAIGEDHPFTAVAFNDSVPIEAWTVTSSWVYTPNSSMVNEMRFGYTRTTFDFVNLDVNKPANGTSSGYLLNTGVTDPLTGGLPNINIGNTFMSLGTATNRPQYFTPNPTYDFQDGISILKGKHNFKFGGEFAHMEADNTIYNLGRGLFNFSGGAFSATSSPLQDFFAGEPSGGPAGQLLVGNPAVKLTWMMTAGYIQDDWRITQKLIVNLGLRYEYFTPMKEANNLWGSFDPLQGMAQQGHGIQSVWKGDHRDFGPRLGFAYDINGKGTTVVRGGASIVHSGFVATDFMGAFGLENNTATSPGAVPTAAAITCGGTAPGGPLVGVPGISPCPASAGGTIGVASILFAPGQLCWDPSVGTACQSGGSTAFPSAVAACGDGINGAPAPCDLMGVDPNLKQPFVLNYNLSVQHQFGANLSLEVAYVGNRGYRLLNFADINQTPLGASYCLNSPTPAQKADACKAGPLGVGQASAAALQEARPYFAKFPYLGFINYVTNRSHSNYNSLQVTLTQRLSHGLSFTAGYTYGHGLDNGSLNRFGGLPQDSSPAGINKEYASGDLDARNRLSVTATYDIPGIKGYGQLLEGWEINAIVNYQSPLPWMAADGIKPGPLGKNFSGTGEQADRWDIFGNPDDFPSSKVSIPFCNGFTVVGGVANASGATCGVTSIYGGILAPSGVNPSKCASLAPDPNTLAAGGCYVSANGNSVLVPEALGTYGTMGRNIFRDSGFKNLDMSIFKNFKFKERYGVQARWEVFNVFNHPTAANPYGAGGFVNTGNALNAPPFGSALATPDFIAGNPLIGSGSQRVMQLGLKISF